MSVAVDQTRLRRIAEAVLAGKDLSRTEAVRILSIAQLAAGIEPEADPAEHAALQAVAQQVGARVGMKPGELLPIPWLPDEETRRAAIEALAAQLETRAARELAYALAFVVSVADMELTPSPGTRWRSRSGR